MKYLTTHEELLKNVGKKVSFKWEGKVRWGVIRVNNENEILVRDYYLHLFGKFSEFVKNIQLVEPKDHCVDVTKDWLPDVKNSIIERMAAKNFAVICENQDQFSKVCDILGRYQKSFSKEFCCIEKNTWACSVGFAEKENIPLISYDDFMAEYVGELPCTVKLDNIELSTNELDNNAVSTKPKHLRLYEAMISGDRLWSINEIKRNDGKMVEFPDSYFLDGIYYDTNKKEFSYMGSDGFEFLKEDDIYFTEEECQQAINNGD